MYESEETNEKTVSYRKWVLSEEAFVASVEQAKSRKPEEEVL